MQVALTRIKQALKIGADTKRALQQSSYMKNTVKFYGLTSKEVSTTFKNIKKEIIEAVPDPKEQIQLATKHLLRSDYFEEKQIAIQILVLQLKLFSKPKHDGLATLIIEQIKTVLDEDEHFNWGTTDSLSSMVLCEIIKKKGKGTAETISQWSYDPKPSLWRLRSSCVTFVKIARHGKYNKLILDQCKHILTGRADELHKERFVQLGVGWVLRELSLKDEPSVIEFLKKHYHHFSREGLRYAIEKMDSETKSNLMKYSPNESEEEEDESEEEEQPKRKIRRIK
ncbi:hypothetical protein AKO1_002909 [Acrasis kona]|uniref:DNA alkylation repair protein n=1 Tax=Acrasis kona TaxID=1008807 RepID=A0AAW2Z9I4_9EUKA